MIVSPLLHSGIRHDSADIVLVEGELECAPEGTRQLIAPFHIHHKDDEIFYVLSGSIGFSIDDDEIIAAAGDAVLVPRGAAHSWWNVGESPARYLIAMSKRLDDLINALHSAPLSPDEMAQVFTDHESTLLGWRR